MWKYITILSVLFISCGSNASGEKAEATNTVQSNVQASNINKPGQFQDPKTKGVKKPDDNGIVPGGPADFTINYSDGARGKVYMIGSYADQNIRMDSAQVSNNATRFIREDGYPQGLYYVLFPNNKYVQVMLGEDQKFTMTTSLADPTQTKVDGSLENQLFYENLIMERAHRAAISPLNQQLKAESQGSPRYEEIKAERQKLIEKRQANLDKVFGKYPDNFFTVFKTAGQNPTLRDELPEDERVTAYRKEFWDNVDFSDMRLMRTPVIKNKLERYFSDLTPQNPDSIKAAADNLLTRVLDHGHYYQFFSNWIVFKYEPTKTTLMDAEAVFVHMIQEYFSYNRAFWSDSTSTYGLQLRAFEMAQSLIGQDGPNVTANDQYGKPQTLLDRTADYLVVYMFNPTCEHCAVETPKLVQLYNEEKGKGDIDVYSIVVDTNEKEWKEYLKENNIEFTSVFDPTNKAIYAKYFVNVTPEIYVLNKERKIVGKNLKVEQIREVIRMDKEN